MACDLRSLLAALAIAAIAISTPAFAQIPIEGSYRTQNGTEVTITPCGDKYCGYLSWVVIPKEYEEKCTTDKAAFATQLLDVNNPDKALQARPIVGLELMHLSRTGNDFSGDVYNAEDGSTVNGIKAWLTDKGQTLRIGGGCIGHMCIGTQDWPRVPTRPGFDFSCGGE